MSLRADLSADFHDELAADELLRHVATRLRQASADRRLTEAQSIKILIAAETIEEEFQGELYVQI